MTGIKDMHLKRRRIRWSLALVTAFGLAVMLPSIAVAQGNPNEACPTELIAKFEVVGGEFVFEEGTEDVITITNVVLDDDGEPTGFDWTSTVEVGVILVKGGLIVEEFDGGTSGTVDFGTKPAISNVQFCGPDEPTDGDSEAPSEAPTDDDSEAPSEAPTDDVSEAPTEGLSELPTEDESESTGVGGVGGGEFPIPDEVDTGAGGAAGMSFPAITAALILVGVTFTGGVTARLIRRRQ
jgi:hypothetical protein